MVYHENPADVARSLSHGGTLLPEPTVEERRLELLKQYPGLAGLLGANEER